MKNLLTLIALCTFGFAASAVADEAQMTMTTIASPSQLKWGDAPRSLPAGAKLAVLSGDPAKPGLFIVHLRLPANYKIPAHWHPTDENISVVSGAFGVGMGDKLDVAQLKTLEPGGFVSLPAKMHHYAMAKKETIIELTSMGPFQINYVNPADDPTRTSSK
jgi:hypothetical protein